jgi:hypothetical protein
MLFNRLIAYCSLLCFILLIGHDIIPHEHSEEIEHHLAHSQDSDHQDHEDEDLNIFSFIPHLDIYAPAHIAKFTDYKIVLTGLCIERISFHNPAEDLPPKIPESLLQILPDYNSSCSSLRAPPYLFS